MGFGLLVVGARVQQNKTHSFCFSCLFFSKKIHKYVTIGKCLHDAYLVILKRNIIISGDDVYKPYDLFSNPDTLFTM